MRVAPIFTGDAQVDQLSREVAEALNGLLALMTPMTVTVSGTTYPALKFGTVTLYVAAGALKAIGGNGTATTVAAA